MRYKRFTALSLAALLGAMGVVPAFGAEIPQKDEVVYVNLTPEGETGTLYVVNNYDLETEAAITDYGDYRSVRNLTTTQELTRNGDAISFTAPAGKFYYQGELDPSRTADLPWTVAVKYFLDGKETPGEELAGKSGRLEMQAALRQNPDADPVYRDNYALQVTLQLDTETCKNIQAEGATQADVGQLKQLSYIILPGKEKDFSVTADVANFEMNGMAINGIPLVLDIDDPDTKELKDQIYDLQDGAAQLDDGALALEDGVSQLEEGAEDLRDGAESLRDGACELNSSLQAMGKGLGSLSPILLGAVENAAKDGYISKEQAAAAKAMFDGLPLLLEGAGELAAGADALACGTEDLYDGVLKLKDGVTELSDGTLQLRDQSSDIDTQVDDKVDEMLDEYRSQEFTPVSFVSSKNTNITAVQFVIKTGDIKLPDVEPAPVEEPGDGTFWERVRDLLPSREK